MLAKPGEALHGVTSPKSPALDPLKVNQFYDRNYQYNPFKYLVSERALESRLARLNEDGGNTLAVPVELFSNSGATAISSKGDSEPTSSSDDSSAPTLYIN